MGQAVFNPDNYCPICGERLPSSADPMKDHCCSEKTLRGIDAATKRDCVQVRFQTMAERLKDGFAMLSDDESEDEGSWWDKLSTAKPADGGRAPPGAKEIATSRAHNRKRSGAAESAKTSTPTISRHNEGPSSNSGPLEAETTAVEMEKYDEYLDFIKGSKVEPRSVEHWLRYYRAHNKSD